MTSLLHRHLPHKTKTGQTIGTCVPGSVKPSPTMIASKWKEPAKKNNGHWKVDRTKTSLSIGMVVKHAENQSHMFLFEIYQIGWCRCFFHLGGIFWRHPPAPANPERGKA